MDLNFTEKNKSQNEKKLHISIPARVKVHTIRRIGGILTTDGSQWTIYYYAACSYMFIQSLWFYLVVTERFDIFLRLDLMLYKMSESVVLRSEAVITYPSTYCIFSLLSPQPAHYSDGTDTCPWLISLQRKWRVTDIQNARIFS